MIFQLRSINMGCDNNKAALERKGTVVPGLRTVIGRRSRQAKIPTAVCPQVYWRNSSENMTDVHTYLDFYQAFYPADGQIKVQWGSLGPIYRCWLVWPCESEMRLLGLLP